MAVPDRSLKELVRGIGGVASGLVLVTFTGLVLYSVMMRYFVSAPPMWGEEVPKLLFVWMIFIGAGFAYLSGANIRMTVLIDKVARGPRRLIELVMHIAIAFMLVVILWYSQPIIRLTSNFTSLATGMSQGWTYWALPLGTCLLLLNELLRIWRLLRGRTDEVSGESDHG